MVECCYSVMSVCLQCVQAAQITFEDYFMADLHIEPLKIVGYEGVFGSLTMILVLLPLVSLIKGHDGDGLHEDSLDTLHVSVCINRLTRVPFSSSFLSVHTACTLE